MIRGLFLFVAIVGVTETAACRRVSSMKADGTFAVLHPGSVDGGCCHDASSKISVSEKTSAYQCWGELVRGDGGCYYDYGMQGTNGDKSTSQGYDDGWVECGATVDLCFHTVSCTCP
jgi:hypothetical protein